VSASVGKNEKDDRAGDLSRWNGRRRHKGACREERNCQGAERVKEDATE